VTRSHKGKTVESAHKVIC